MNTKHIPRMRINSKTADINSTARKNDTSV